MLRHPLALQSVISIHAFPGLGPQSRRAFVTAVSAARAEGKAPGILEKRYCREATHGARSMSLSRGFKITVDESMQWIILTTVCKEFYV